MNYRVLFWSLCFVALLIVGMIAVNVAITRTMIHMTDEVGHVR